MSALAHRLLWARSTACEAKLQPVLDGVLSGIACRLQETRFRQRYLDMIVNPRPRDIFQIRSQIIRYIRRYLDDRDFTEVGFTNQSSTSTSSSSSSTVAAPLDRPDFQTHLCHIASILED